MTTRVEWRETEDDFGPWAVEPDGSATRAVWAPLPGSQDWFLRSTVFETVIEGPRGTAKTTALLADFAKDVGTGLGADWNGVLFRQSYKAFNNLIKEAKALYGASWGDEVSFRESAGAYRFKWATGEELHLHVLSRPAQYDDYHGQQIPWLGFEELTTWADAKCFLMMFSCSRTTNPNVDCRVRASFNPGGIGHNWVKRRYQLPVPAGDTVGTIIREGGLERVAVHSKLDENMPLLRATPDYVDKIRALAAARGGAHLVKAWVDGDWNITAGGMFDDVWEDGQYHVIPDLPLAEIPRGWRVDRSFDWGLSKPFSVGWWAESNGEPWEVNGREYGTVPGDIFRVAEWYGWNGRDNEGLRMEAGEIAQGILQREREWGLTGRVRNGPADSSIFDDYEPTKSYAGDMLKVGVQWDHADKRPGSRKQGWGQLRKCLLAAKKSDREEPGLWVCKRCYDGFIRTVPVLPRDERDTDDVDTNAEDHAGDETRYRLRHKRRAVERKTW